MTAVNIDSGTLDSNGELGENDEALDHEEGDNPQQEEAMRGKDNRMAPSARYFAQIHGA